MSIFCPELSSDRLVHEQPLWLVVSCDYRLCSHVTALIASSRSYYTYGVNWRAYAAYIAGIAPNMAGFVGAIGVDVPEAATRIYA